MKPYTMQQALNRVHKYFVVERHPIARNSTNGMCMYRTTGHRRCAIGCLIPDRLYDKEIEGTSAREATRYSPELQELFSQCETSFLDELQTIHDNIPSAKNTKGLPSQHVKRFRLGLADLAERYELRMPR